MPVGASEAFTFTFVFLSRRSARKLWMMPHFVTVHTSHVLHITGKSHFVKINSYYRIVSLESFRFEYEYEYEYEI